MLFGAGAFAIAGFAVVALAVVALGAAFAAAGFFVPVKGPGFFKLNAHPRAISCPTLRDSGAVRYV